MKQQKILLIGGPGTGKSTLINYLKKEGFVCFSEISRSVIQEAQKKGIDQLFLTDPLLFSEMLLQGRIDQFLEAEKSEAQTIFMDRGIPDVTAYLDYVNQKYPENFAEANKRFRYDKVFLFPLWKEIYRTDLERYESFEQAREIQKHLSSTYRNLGHELIHVPMASVPERAKFILDALNHKS